MEKTAEQKNRNYLKVVFYGAESTGKTTLAKTMAKTYHTAWVPEYAREYLQKKYEETGEICAPEDLMPIAQGQLKLERELAQKTNEILFCDTNVLQTYFYGTAYYRNFRNPTLKKLALQQHYDLYFLTYIDTPWEVDDLRDRPNQRLAMHEHFKKSLTDLQIPFVVLKGSLVERIKLAREKINQLLKNDGVTTIN